MLIFKSRLIVASLSVCCLISIVQSYRDVGGVFELAPEGPKRDLGGEKTSPGKDFVSTSAGTAPKVDIAPSKARAATSVASIAEGSKTQPQQQKPTETSQVSSPASIKKSPIASADSESKLASKDAPSEQATTESQAEAADADLGESSKPSVGGKSKRRSKKRKPSSSEDEPEDENWLTLKGSGSLKLPTIKKLLSPVNKSIDDGLKLILSVLDRDTLDNYLQEEWGFSIPTKTSRSKSGMGNILGQSLADAKQRRKKPKSKEEESGRRKESGDQPDILSSITKDLLEMDGDMPADLVLGALDGVWKNLVKPVLNVRTQNPLSQLLNQREEKSKGDDNDLFGLSGLLEGLADDSEKRSQSPLAAASTTKKKVAPKPGYCNRLRLTRQILEILEQMIQISLDEKSFADENLPKFLASLKAKINDYKSGTTA